jgi:Mg2+/citrate symporter
MNEKGFFFSLQVILNNVRLGINAEKMNTEKNGVYGDNVEIIATIEICKMSVSMYTVDLSKSQKFASLRLKEICLCSLVLKCLVILMFCRQLKKKRF